MKSFRLLLQITPWIICMVLGGFFFMHYKSNQEKPIQQQSISGSLITKVQAMGKIELVHYHFKEAQEFTKDNFWVSDDQILLIASTEAVGCIDLQQIREKDIEHKGDTVYIILPYPEVCFYKIDHKNSKVYDMSLAKFMDKTSLIDSAYKLAEAQIVDRAIEAGILEETKRNANLILKPLFEKVSDKTVFLGYRQSIGYLKK